ncbi:MAG: M28 family peptidase [Gemmatimonadetes bacterium]|nr:M28 family peptidase [Gemmatimonadota bacterium]
MTRLALLLAFLGLASPSLAAPPFDGDRAMELLVAQVELGPRNPGSEGHRAALAWMRAELRKTADTVQPHAFTLPDPYGGDALHLTNLKASFRPSRPDRIAFAAHWDTRPRADREPTGPVETPIPGANDGASGVAVLLVLAEILAQNPPPLGVDLLFFDGEDYGLEGEPEHYSLGAKRYVADHPGYRPQAVILLDMVGKANLHIPMEGNSLANAPQLTQAVFQRALDLGLPAFQAVPGRGVMDDHVPFLQVGVPALNLIDMDYPAWHTLSDTPDQCSPESLAQVGTLVVSLIYDGFSY